jgi:hypothetical protein
VDGRDALDGVELPVADIDHETGQVEQGELGLARGDRLQRGVRAAAENDVDVDPDVLEVALVPGHPHHGVAADRTERGHVGDLVDAPVGGPVVVPAGATGSAASAPASNPAKGLRIVCPLGRTGSARRPKRTHTLATHYRPINL